MRTTLGAAPATCPRCRILPCFDLYDVVARWSSAARGGSYSALKAITPPFCVSTTLETCVRLCFRKSRTREVGGLGFLGQFETSGDDGESDEYIPERSDFLSADYIDHQDCHRLLPITKITIPQFINRYLIRHVWTKRPFPVDHCQHSA
jgi:hypothetical protein